jgi:hypothetical protein
MRRYVNFPRNVRRSDPVISFGSSTASIPSMVGEISRSEPFGFSVYFAGCGMKDLYTRRRGWW